MTSTSKAREEIVDTAPGRASDFNTKMIQEFRANQGRVGGPWADTTLILIHHIGARSGTERVTPLGCSHQGDGRFAIAASNGGSPAHPDWYYNLKANPRIKVEVGTQTFTVLAEELDDTTRAGLSMCCGVLGQIPDGGRAARTVDAHRRLFHGRPRTGRVGGVFLLKRR